MCSDGWTHGSRQKMRFDFPIRTANIGGMCRGGDCRGRSAYPLLWYIASSDIRPPKGREPLGRATRWVAFSGSEGDDLFELIGNPYLRAPGNLLRKTAENPT